jgi:predicted DNA-binding transcriptional regulator YafY
MRADRLVAIVLLLQARGQLSARELAELLETSERTIRRDLDALGVAGVPLYSLRGRNGGWALLGGHRLDLSGFTVEEAQALFMVAGSPGRAGNEVEHGLRSALRKVFTALPEPLRVHATAASQATVFDPLGWGRSPDALPMLEPLRAAVMAKVQVDLEYAKPNGAPLVRRVHPYGLVAKSGVWYLLAGTSNGRRTFRISRVNGVTTTQEPVILPDGFDLASEWESAQRDFMARAQAVTVTVEVKEPAVLAFTSSLQGWASMTEVESPTQGWRRMTVAVPHISAAAAVVAGFGANVRVHSPPELRTEVVSIAQGVLAANRVEERAPMPRPRRGASSPRGRAPGRLGAAS